MTKIEAIHYLRNWQERFQNLMKLFDFPAAGMSEKENFRLISSEYSKLKEQVSSEKNTLERNKAQAKVSDIELCFVLPALSDVVLHCIARKNSRNKQELISSIYDGKSYFSYWAYELEGHQPND